VAVSTADASGAGSHEEARTAKAFPKMNFKDILRQKKHAILERWFRLILDSYPPDASRLFENLNDPFGNPVGCAISSGIEELFDVVMGAGEIERAVPALDRIIRIRAVQDFSRARAVEFVVRLKDAIRDELAREIRDGKAANELSKLESRIDEMALLASVVYGKCREQIDEIRAKELRRKMFTPIDRTGPMLERGAVE
jgi:hypothetical protein